MRRTIPTVLLLVLLASATACSRSGTSNPDRATGPNVVLIVIDTLRADHLSCYGYPHDTSPYLSELAARSFVFERCYAPCSWTAPSTASLFTSVYPCQHGVTLGDRYYRPGNVEPPPTRLNRIPAALETLPEIMRKVGYRTYGVSDNYFVSRTGGFDRGFDRFVQFEYHTADAVNEALLEWADEIKSADEPYFLYVHYVDPHWPYHPREPWRREGDAASENRRNYDSEIGFVDDRIRQLADELEFGTNTLLIVTSDHGEEFMEHGQEGHRFQLYQELLHVPLIVNLPGGSQAARVEEETSLLDLLPTLRAWIGAPASHQDEGISLLPATRGKPLPRRTLFAMRTKEADVLLAEKWAVLDTTDKYIVTLPTSDEELYDLAVDPGEQTNLVEGEGALLDTPRAALEHFQDDARIYEREFVDLGVISPEMKERLRSLGYVH